MPIHTGGRRKHNIHMHRHTTHRSVIQTKDPLHPVFLIAMALLLVVAAWQTSATVCENPCETTSASVCCEPHQTCYKAGQVFPGGPEWAVCCDPGHVGCGRPGGLNGICINNATQTCCFPSGTAQVVPIACDKFTEVCRRISSVEARCEPLDAPLTCFGVLASSPQVCSQAGTCVGQDQCSCFCGRAGDRCEISVCFGKIAFDPNVCSGNGGCAAPDTCVCRPGFTGSRCQFLAGSGGWAFSCFGRLPDDPLVCSGRGACLAQDTCSCNDGGQSGNQCQQNLAVVEG